MNIEKFKQEGYQGFVAVESLMKNECLNVPNEKGIYLILKNGTQKEFLSESVGGHFKEKNPTVAVSVLDNKWIEESDIIYIGQAGGGSSGATLKKRLKQYMKFGKGEPVGHWGGRYIWQLKENRKLIVCWRATPNEDPRVIEKEMIETFESSYGGKPFANIAG